MISVDTLIEQTAFLAEKQTEAQKECGKIFDDLLATIQTKIIKVKNNPDEVASLEHVYSLMSEQSEKLFEEAQVDIDFLTEQLTVLHKIKDVKDQTKAQELLEMLLDEEEEIKDTESFKKEISEEAEISKQNLMALVDDIKLAIQEGSTQDVEIYLESLLKEDGADDEDLDDELDDADYFNDDDCGGCSGEKGCCGSKNKSKSDEKDACQGCCGETDIFVEFKKDQEKKITH